MAVVDEVDRRAIEWDCTQLLYRFYACLDEHRYDELATLFAPTGVWVRLGTELVGPANILEGIRERQSWVTAHLVTNVRIQVVSCDEARSSQFVTLYRHENWDAADGPAPVVLPLGILRHQDELTLQGGVWRFQRKTSRAVMVDRSRVTHYER